MKEVPEHIVPLLTVIVGFALEVIDIVDVGDEPHALEAETEMLPLFVPVVTLIVFVVEVPDQPPGMDHI